MSPLWQSTALTLAGSERTANEDALLELPARGAWAVADGMGGHSLGFAASRIVIAAIQQALSGQADTPLGDNFAARIATVTEALHIANAQLRALALGGGTKAAVGATIVVILVTADRAAVLWVGDSRLYVMRNLALHQITGDHAETVEWREAGSADPAPRMRRVLTRAVGSHDQLEIETINIGLDAADRLLLCSDGFYKVFADVEIAQSLLGSAADAAAGILHDAAGRKVPDDLTVIAIERVPSAPP